jgi:hypothetical protein
MYRTRLPASDVAALDALIGDALNWFGYPVSRSASPVPPRLAAQLLESDTVTNPENLPYRRWHEERRKERKARGVWSNADRQSLLWGIH